MSQEEKSKNQIKNEAKRAEKMAKFLAKQEKLKTDTSSSCNSKASSKKYSYDQNDIESQTLLGEKKDLSHPMAPSYHPKAVESTWYSWWQSKGFFKPELSQPNAPIYVIPIPPPNVTGSLHLGHALTTSIQDSLIRWKRMQGYAALYVPGCDHAGISCQVVVEKYLKKTKNLTRHDLGREAFLEQVWKWKNSYGDRIYEQFKRLGGSMDWDRVKFTMDPDLAESVTTAFITMFEQGLIYRDNRLVNWSAKIQTGVSDLEVEHREINEPIKLSAYGHDPKKLYDFGLIYDFAYKLEDGSEICVSTTRPETVPGDVAVAVHPDDPRYKPFHNKQLIHPIHKTKVPLVLDTYVDMNFGTGAVKITPAHDMNDFDIAIRHNLPMISIFDEHNRLTSTAGPFQGMMRFDAREAIISYLKKENLFRGSKPHSLVLPICNRSGDIIEPRLCPQWWMKCKDLAMKAVDAVKTKQLCLIPSENEKVWFNWLENCRDWCISRQLWWGHRIPAYSVQIRKDDEYIHKMWIAAPSLEEAYKKARESISDKDIKLEQDSDVLDTWFSSALWPFSIFGWPRDTNDYSKFYPTSLLETGRDIIFFWVARMVMMGIHLTGSIPFHTVYLHSIIRDAHGRKMSKSLGNVIDPLDVIEGVTLEVLSKRLEEGNLDPNEIQKAKEGQKKDFPNGIAECGTDALRFALCNYTTQGSDINLDIKRIEGYRRFCNKLWNACKFALIKFGDGFIPDENIINESSSLFDRWILMRLGFAIQEVTNGLEEYNFMKATNAIYAFLLYDVCDVYIEASKNIEDTKNISKNILYICLENGFKLLHPFMPFITEELYQRLPFKNGKSESISISKWPVLDENWTSDQDKLQSQMTFLQSMIHEIRGSGQGSKKFNADVLLGDLNMQHLIDQEMIAIKSLIKGMELLKVNNDNSVEAFKVNITKL